MKVMYVLAGLLGIGVGGVDDGDAVAGGWGFAHRDVEPGR